MEDFRPRGNESCLTFSTALHLLWIYSAAVLYICHHLRWDPPVGTVASDPEKISTGGQNNLRVITLQQKTSLEWSLSWDVFSLISALSGEGGREHGCLRVWHARTGRRRWRQAWVHLILIRCVVSWRSNEAKGEGGISQRISNGTQETVIHRFWPLHLSTCSRCAASHWQLKGGWGSQTGEVWLSPLNWAVALKPWAIGAANRFWHFTAHLRRLHIFVWDCFYNSHCGSLSPTLVAYAGGWSLSGSQWVCRAVDGGLWGRRWGWWESIL